MLSPRHGENLLLSERTPLGGPIKIIEEIAAMGRETERLRQEGKSVVFVPTMGYLHEGHLSLIRKGREHGDILVLSIFVNPTQFGPAEDFQTYPRDLDRDVRLARREGVETLFVPQAHAMYGKGYQTFVDLTVLPNYLCGPWRPGHFRGVATVVAKLFNIVKPHVAVFGEKDYQQLVVIRRMAEDLNWHIQILGVPTVREPDGLAMSSRNVHLSADERRSALSLVQSLRLGQEMVSGGITDAEDIIREASDLIGSRPHNRIEYVTLCDPDTLEDVQYVDGPSLMALAVRVGKTRLIDNTLLQP
jgi:pantoate--beta-alanine ligase